MYTQQTKNYYNNSKKVSHYGKSYDSQFEGKHGLFLESEKQAGNIKDFETHIPIELIVNDFLVATYQVDFKVYHNDGTIEYVETKGVWTSTARLKWKLFEALYSDDPNNKLTVIMQGKGKPPKARKKKKLQQKIK